MLINLYRFPSLTKYRVRLLTAALAALDTLKPADITLVKSMKNPPRPIKTVMAAVCVMKDIKPEKILDPGGSGKKVTGYSDYFKLCITSCYTIIRTVLLTTIT